MKKIVEHNPEWKEIFEIESGFLTKLVGPIAVDIHHIGSTAISGIPAKPIIDILLVVSSLSELDHLNSKFELLGYKPRGEHGIPKRRYFSKKTRTSVDGFHLHAFENGNSAVRKHILFRDYLRIKPDLAAQYGHIKRQKSSASGVLELDYQEFKSEWVETVTKQAVQHYKFQQR